VAPEVARAALEILLDNGIEVGLNASGGEPGQGLEESAQIAEASGGRLLPLCNLSLTRVLEPGFDAYVRESLERCRALGGKGLKLSKFLGLGLTDRSGKLVAVDDPSLDPVFEHAGRLGLPVLIHSGDPRAFFEPIDAANERLAELTLHPGWSFHGTTPYGEPWPSWTALLDQHERRVARHPGTRFVGAHFGNCAEDPDRVARMLRRYPNYFIDTSARVPEFGRHPAERMRAFFVEFADRVLFGSDMGAGPGGLTLGSGDGRPHGADDARAFFEAHFRYFETDEPRLPSPTPIQGDWPVHGVGLPREVLEKLYWRNAARVFALDFGGSSRPAAQPPSPSAPK
jgi:predicted TIM-barrel fold metal-dependent hydrolase